jgi:hypothetical protein
MLIASNILMDIVLNANLTITIMTVYVIKIVKDARFKAQLKNAINVKTDLPYKQENVKRQLLD